MELELTARKWGNSIAVVIPSSVVEKEKIKENQKLTIDLKSKKPLLVKDVFGMFKGQITRSTQEIKDDMRAGWLSETDRKQEEGWKRKQKI